MTTPSLKKNVSLELVIHGNDKSQASSRPAPARPESQHDALTECISGMWKWMTLSIRSTGSWIVGMDVPLTGRTIMHKKAI